MSHSFKTLRRGRFRLPAAALLVMALLACDNTDSLNPDSSGLPEETGPTLDPLSTIEEDTPVDEDLGLQQAGPLNAALEYRGGIPMGTTSQPNSEFGSLYNGALRTISPAYLLRDLAAIKSRGGKVVLMLAGHPRYYGEHRGFNLSDWKERVARFRNLNFSSYVRDGTIVAHYLLDEPNDASNWGGDQVSPSTVEEMARYSKQLWPDMPTVVRAEPGYMGFNHRYLDAAWAQYVTRKGTATEYLRRNVANAQERGLGLVVGLNILKGGPNGSRMTARQVRDWGEDMLASSYSCAFISWKYEDDYLDRSDMRDAMRRLADLARNRGSRSCKSS